VGVFQSVMEASVEYLVRQRTLFSQEAEERPLLILAMFLTSAGHMCLGFLEVEVEVLVGIAQQVARVGVAGLQQTATRFLGQARLAEEEAEEEVGGKRLTIQAQATSSLLAVVVEAA